MASIKEIAGALQRLQGFQVGRAVGIGSTDGTKTIARAKKVFNLRIDSSFADWNLDVPAAKTDAMKVVVLEMLEEDGAFSDLYTSLGCSLDELCLTQNQIIDFCVKYKGKLTFVHGTKFLFKVGTQYFVASVSKWSCAELSAGVGRIPNDPFWYAKERRRFVLPQLVNPG